LVLPDAILENVSAFTTQNKESIKIFLIMKYNHAPFHDFPIHFEYKKNLFLTNNQSY